MKGWSSTLPTAIAALSSKVFVAPVSTWWSFILYRSNRGFISELKTTQTPVPALTSRHLCLDLRQRHSWVKPLIFLERAADSHCSAANAIRKIQDGGPGWRRLWWRFLPQFRWCSFKPSGKKRHVYEVQVSMSLASTFSELFADQDHKKCILKSTRVNFSSYSHIKISSNGETVGV